MRHLDLFSGIGGFALAASWVWGDKHELVSFCDNDHASQVVLKHHWPGVPIHDDIKALDATKWRGTIDLVSGGFPCQPFSCAGKRRGAADDRYLWPEMLRVIAECRPRWVLGENVAGIVNMELDQVLADLAGAGYETWPLVIPACAIDAPHIRARVWIVAHYAGAGCKRTRGRIPENGNAPRRTDTSDGRQDVADAAQELLNGSGNTGTRRREESTNGRHDANADGKSMGRITEPRQECRQWLPEPNVGRVANGIPHRVHRLRLLGNAIVPQVAKQIFQAMKAVDK